MNAERLKLIEEVFHEISGISPHQRESFFTEHCGGDTELRREVEALIAFQNISDELLEASPALLAAEMFADEEISNLAGRQINQYKILSPLGRGGMGTVYLAEDTRLDRRVAVKFLNAEFVQNADKLNRFIREAKAASALNHPNILTVYGIGEHGGAHYFAMEFIDGEVLKKKKRRIETVLDISVQIVSALSVAHEAGIVHRDIKPENIMMRRDGIVKILDFGLAKLVGFDSSDAEKETKTLIELVRKNIQDANLNPKLTSPGMIMGTPHYMSPEQAEGSGINHQTDIFSFGVVLYEMLSGKLPFSGETIDQIIQAILETEPEPLENIPGELRKIVRKTLMKARENRYQTALDLLNDLKKLQTEITVQSALKSSIKNQEEDDPINSIAVMPFVNESNNEDIEFLADGMTETLIGNLARIPNLSVKARSTVFYYKDKNITPKKIGEELNVGAVLLGRIVRRGEAVKLGLELVETKTLNALWSETYERGMSDLAQLQSEIAASVFRKLRKKLFGDDEKNIAKIYTTDRKAYEAYLKGRFYWNKRNEENLLKAIEYFEQAIELDPGYALAYCGLADSFSLLPNYGVLPSREAIPKARRAAEKAVGINPLLAESHTSLGYVLKSEWKFSEAEKEYQRSIELNSNYAVAHHWYGDLLFRLERPAEAEKQFEIGLEIDPLSEIMNRNFGDMLYMWGKYEKAEKQIRKALEINPDCPYSNGRLSEILARKGKRAEAFAAANKAIEAGLSNAKYQIALLEAVSGNAAAARKHLSRIESEKPESSFYIAVLCANLGEKDKALRHLENLYKNRYPLEWFLPSREFDTIRDDPRFKAIKRAMGLPD